MSADVLTRLRRPITRMNAEVTMKCETALEAADEIERLRATLDIAVDVERERCISACKDVMNSYGGDPAGRLLATDRVRMQHQLQASGAAQCIARIEV